MVALLDADLSAEHFSFPAGDVVSTILNAAPDRPQPFLAIEESCLEKVFAVYGGLATLHGSRACPAARRSSAKPGDAAAGIDQFGKREREPSSCTIRRSLRLPIRKISMEFRVTEKS